MTVISSIGTKSTLYILRGEAAPLGIPSTLGKGRASALGDELFSTYKRAHLRGVPWRVAGVNSYVSPMQTMLLRPVVIC